MTTRYVFDWPALDAARIRAAAAAVAQTFPDAHVEVVAEAPASAACFFVFPVRVARAFDARGDFDDRLARYGGGRDDEDLCVEVAFSHRPADGAEPACCDLVFNPAANFLCGGIGRTVLERLAAALGGVPADD